MSLQQSAPTIAGITVCNPRLLSSRMLAPALTNPAQQRSRPVRKMKVAVRKSLGHPTPISRILTKMIRVPSSPRCRITLHLQA